MKQLGVNNLPKVVAQQRYGRGSNPRPLDRKSDALPISHHANTAITPPAWKIILWNQYIVLNFFINISLLFIFDS